jgi:hypothetical protein
MLFYVWSLRRAPRPYEKSRGERPSPYEAIGLPLNPMECGKDFMKLHMVPFPLVSQIMATKEVESKEEQIKRRLADSTFRYGSYWIPGSWM